MAESPEGTMTFTSPTVVRRVYKIQYQPAQADNEAQGSVKSRTGGRRVSMKTYDRDTDNDIFKLGSAFKSGNFDVDEFLNSWNTTGGYRVEKVETSTNEDQGTTTITQVRSVSPSHGEPSPSGSPHTTMSALPDSFPSVVRRQRIITTICRKSNESSPVDGPPEPTMNSFSVRPVPSTLDVPTLTPITPVEEKTEEPTPKSDSVLSQPLLTGPEGPEEQEDILETNQEDTESASVQVEENHSSSGSEEDIETRWRRSLCPGRKPYRNRPRRKMKKVVVDGHKGGARTGMTASEVSVPGQEIKLPAIQRLILSYSQMLDRCPEQFKETLFRAVKLNGLDVVKILCQLVVRKNIPLGSYEMREPESSATILHVALLYDHEDIVEHLIKLGDRNLLMATYTKEEYKNQTALHVAVANGNVKIVEMLLKGLSRKDKKTLLNTVATGTYFQRKHPEGQLCVSAAAWSGNSDILILLARHGASFAIANLEGNTLLHRIILASAENPDQTNYSRLIEKVFEAVGEWAKHRKYKATIADQRELEQTQKQINTFHKLLNIQNNDGETPLILAAQQGSPLLLYLINMEKIFKIPQTKLGSIAWLTYDVTDVTTYAEGAYNKFSVLHVLAHNSGKLSRHANLDRGQDDGFLDAEPIKSLIDMKWGVYRWIYIGWCLVHLIYIILFTYFTFDGNSLSYDHHPGANNVSQCIQAPRSGDSSQSKVQYWHCLFILLPIVYIILEMIDWFGNYPYSILFMRHKSFFSKVAKRIQSEWVITGNGPYRLVCLGYSCSAIIWYILYINRHCDQDVALATALLLGWVFVLFFTRGCRVTSRFSIMIQKMFFRDLMYFLAVYIMILAAFSFSINAMYSHLHLPRTSLPNVMYRMMNIVTQLDEKQEFQDPSHPLFTKILLVFYAIVAVILLMNMLIAMMNTSYETVRITRCNIWKQQQLSIMLMMERRLVWCKCICQMSESDVWHKEWEESTKAYLDVTTTQHRERTPE